MTRDEGMAQFDRFAYAGYPAPAEDAFAGAFEEWFAIVERHTLETVTAAVTRLIRTRSSRFWPTVAEMRDALAAETSGPRSDARCATCHGSGWVEAPPYRANGGLRYEGVTRCPDCGIPAPKTEWLRGQHTPIDGHELREWARETHAEPLTQAEMLARCKAITARMAIPKLRLVEKD